MNRQGEGQYIVLKDSNGVDTVFISGPAGRIRLGGEGEDGDIDVADGENTVTVKVNGDRKGEIKLGPNKVPSIWLSGDGVMEVCGRSDADGQLIGGEIHLSKPDGDVGISLYGHRKQISLGAGQNDERIRLDGANADIWVGNSNASGDIYLADRNGGYRIRLNGAKGRIELPHGDCAENFSVAEGYANEPGMVMVMGRDEKVQPCSDSYDRRVVGVVAGANDAEPGILLNSREDQDGSCPIAMMGRVYCKVDADFGPIQVGDLLTTSPTVGHAMKASDAARSFGAVVGKSLQSLEGGRSTVLVLIFMQ